MMQTIFNGFSYYWENDKSFLSINQIQYSLENLWRLCAGDAKWEGLPVIHFSAITQQRVDQMLKSAPNTMPWIPLVNVLPKDTPHHLDTESLPAICLVNESDTITYTGIGNYPLDLVAATFILLSRWEEWKYPKLDQYGRHQEDATLCARQNFRERPILDEWAMMLQPWLKMHNQAWQPKLPKYSTWITHDIDHLHYYKNFSRLCRGIVRDILNRKLINTIFSNIKSGLISLIKDSRQDPCFKAILDLIAMDESLGLKGTFFFMSAKTSKFDEGYNLKSSDAQHIISIIKNHDHEIGWHPSFFSMENDSIFKQELDTLLKNIQAKNIGARHHYLRWSAGTSWKRMANVGIIYDSSVGYNHNLGFRSSTSKFYPAYDLIEDKVLPLEVRPFVAMDAALLRIEPQKLIKLIRRIQCVNGCFSVIIHNYTAITHPEFIKHIYSVIKNETQ